MSGKQNQHGMALLVSLLLLLILTILAISMASTSTLQQRIASNSQQQNVAFQAAESGLQYWVDQYISTGAALPDNSEISLIQFAGTSAVARVRLSSSVMQCAKFLPAQSLDVKAGSLSYSCYQISSQAKACPPSGTCNVTAADGQARALHQRSYIQATHL